ncbi:CRISPR-associated endonuclease Cas2 [compost metagenome]
MMLVLITYDVSTTDAEGRRRLSRVAKKCVDYGQRVQNSVFECILDETQYRRLKLELEGLIDRQTDSLRFYNLGNNYKKKVDHTGVKASYDMEGPLIL